jgi:hypothetical protein
MKCSKLFLLTFIGILSYHIVAAEGFDNMISLPEVNARGFHKIIISPAISAKTASNFSDFRLYDVHKKEVPYILRKDFIRKHHQTFIPYQLIAKSTPGDTATEIIVKNQFHTKINNLGIFLNNAEVSKQIIISGSYDKIQWYAVKQNYNISSISNNNNVVELNTIYFPLSDYNFYKILINDKNSLPVKVVQAGYYQDSTSYGEETLLQTPQIKRTENTQSHVTQIDLNFNSEYNIDKIDLNILSPTLFQRPVRIYALRKSEGKEYKEFLQETTLQSSTKNQIILDNVRAAQLILEIENNNNPLLQIEKITCYQLSQYIIAYLEEKGMYTLKFGNKTLLPPVYDLAYFEKIIPANIPVIETSHLSIIIDPDKPVAKTIEPAYYNKKVFLWTAIVAVTLVLLLISGKMLNEMNKKK